jgi:hypothetical protein
VTQLRIIELGGGAAQSMHIEIGDQRLIVQPAIGDARMPQPHQMISQCARQIAALAQLTQTRVAVSLR